MAQVSYGTITITDTNDIESITVEYNRNQSSSSAPSPTDSGWSTTRPDWAQGYYIWQRTRVHKSGTTTDKDVIGTAVCITGSTGSSGTSVTISSIKYAVSTTESQPADSSFTHTSVPTVAEGAWLWTLVTYSNGSKAYTKSKQGVSGDSITVSKVEYQSGTSPTSAPTGTWQTSIPTVAEGNYLWTKTTYSDGNYTYSVAKQGKSGTSVSISSTSTTYQVSTSPTTTPTGEWKTTVQSTTTGQYLWTRTVVTYSDGNSTTSYSVAAHGATGTSISISSIKYAVSSTDSQPADNSFTYTSVPTVNEGQWLWTLTTYSNGSKMYTKSKQGKSGDDGRSLTTTETRYVNVASGTTQSQIEALADNVWVKDVPTYDSTKPDYWGRIKNTYDKAPINTYIYYKDNAISESLYNAAIANSIAQQTIEDAQGALSIATGINQHFFSIPSDYSASVPAGSYITEKNVSEFKQSPSGGNLLTRSDGVWLRNGADILASLQGTGLTFLIPTGTYKGRKSLEILGGTSPALKLYDAQNNSAVATLNSNGLVLSRGGIRVNTVGSNNGVYISSENLGSVISSLVPTPSGGTPKTNWRAVIGSKFGVDSAGNLYANEAHISGAINATSLTIGSGSSAYNGAAAINISGYDIQITQDSTGAADGTTYLIPHLYHNGVEVTSGIDYTKFVWYQDNVSPGTEGDASHQGRYLATYGHNYRVTYDFDDGAVQGGTTVETRYIDPSKYITKINDTGITVHPEDTSSGQNILINSSGVQIRKGTLPMMNLDNDSLDFNTIDVVNNTYKNIASFGETTRIGYNNETKMVLSSNSFDMVDVNGLSISHIGNPTNQLLLDVFFYDSTQTDPNIFVLSEEPTTIEKVTINDEETTNYTLHDLNQVTINDTLTDDDKISITYKFAGEASYYTFGYRKDGGGEDEEQYFTVGQYSFAAGCYLSATGTASHAEGYNTEAKGHSSHAEGHETIAWQDHAHAEGDGCQADGEASHAEGRDTTASGLCSHAEGRNTIASGNNSHAEGRSTHASGQSSHAGGSGTIAWSRNQTVIGEWNEVIKQAESMVRPPAFILGNGTSDTNRSNAFTISWNGSVKAAGSITDGQGYSIPHYSEEVITSYESGWTVYASTDISAITVRKYGRFVTLTGVMKNTAAKTINTGEQTMFTIPEGYRPMQVSKAMCQGTDTATWVLTVNTNGTVTASRYRLHANSYPSVAAGSWFPFHITYISAD